MIESSEQDMVRPAGFWLRLCSVSIDLITITVVVVVAANILASFEYYIPQELTIIILYMLYSALSVALWGQTLGKWLCGIKVVSRNGNSVGIAASVIRAVFAAISLCLVGLPFLFVATRREKRGLHDRLSGTKVQTLSSWRTGRRWAITGFAALVLVFLVPHVVAWAKLYFKHKIFHKSADIAFNKQPWINESTVKASVASSNQINQITSWISENAQEPVDYLVDFADRHQLTIVGELHGIIQYLDFLNEAIYDLYHKAGVRVIALECCRSDQDADIQNLLAAEEFNTELALKITRGGSWHAWGYKRHWDVLETVWRLNRSLPDDSEPMRIVGIFPPCELISFRMTKEGYIYRLFRALDDLPWLAMHDAHYARRVELQAFKKWRRTLVWVGAAHAIKCCSHQVVYRDTVKNYFRMGSMLCGRYGDQVGTILLHGDYFFPTITELIEKCSSNADKNRAGYDITGSPLAEISEDFTQHVRLKVDLPFKAYFSGYIILAPLDQIEKCDWWEGYISPRMFGLYKPLYEMLCERKLKDHREANQYMQQGIQNL
jgi:uncharacterized RDD family membrane protein YckC